ncbi:MAG: hypothetical protein PHZ26_02000 [Candidatus Gracilibacteria bacterium]|nr:hypothetical protein [Candidatus Gracilibacteria bacterium]MDD2908507.1 hypothetical protein [Candidatus Gracilibacteria bacterium]
MSGIEGNKIIKTHNPNSGLDESFLVQNGKLEDKDRIISSEELEKLVKQREIAIQETRFSILLNKYDESDEENKKNIEKLIIKNYDDNPNNETSNFHLGVFYYKNLDKMLFFLGKSLHFGIKHKKDIEDLTKNYFIRLTNKFITNPDIITINEKNIKQINDYGLSGIYREFLNKQLKKGELNINEMELINKIISNLK